MSSAGNLLCMADPETCDAQKVINRLPSARKASWDSCGIGPPILVMQAAENRLFRIFQFSPITTEKKRTELKMVVN